MKLKVERKDVFIFCIMWAIAALPLAIGAQTTVKMPKNKYQIADDIKLGQQASVEAEKQFPVLNDRQAQQYVQRVGERLVAAIPRAFQQSGFSYSFKVVNASDINAFALPGGPMYVNRGMIESAKNEGEMAGVMAHEISHVALRHATAQATKAGSWKNQLGTIGLVLGGAVLGGETGAQIGMLGAQAWMTKFSREYETQADILGAQIMANAGYDPHDLANMFQTIAKQGGGNAPEWLSSHPDPGNRFEKINREADQLRISQNPIKITQEFSRVREHLQAMPPAKSMAQLDKEYKQNNQENAPNPMAGGRYSSRVQYPSTSMRAYNSNGLQVSVPSNWKQFDAQGLIFAPEGAYGDEGITHGAMFGTFSSNNQSDAATASTEYVNSILLGNQYLRQQSRLVRATIGGRRGYTTTLSGQSPLTNEMEVVTVYTLQLNNGVLLYIDTVSPQNESARYSNAFRNMLNSVRIND